MVAKETILNKLFEAEWTASMAYLSTDSYSVPSSGLYVLYESPIVYTTFDAVTGTNSYNREPEEEVEEIVDNEVFIPIPTVAPVVREESIEAIVSVTPTMEIVRQSEIDEDEHGIVWREKGFTAQSDKTMNSFIEDRFEQTVKATIQTSTNILKGFVWFKERMGDLDLTFEACRNIAVAFITTYYREYIPYLQMKVEEPSFSSVHRAFFTFPITIDGYRLDSESFMISVNKTTGFIDRLMTPHLNISTIQAYTATPILKLFEAKRALTDVDATLEWTKNYDSDEPQEILKYTFAHDKTQQSIRGINAVTGELIIAKY